MFRIPFMIKLKASLLAGFIAVCVHTVLLKSALLFNLEVESGGLFRLLRVYFGDAFSAAGIGSMWASVHLPMPGTTAFWVLFHTFMGLVLAVGYAFAIEPFLKGSGMVKGAIYSLLPWVINSVLVMPLLGNGFAASKALGMAGMTWFFVANTLYGVLVGILYERFSRSFAAKQH